MFFVRNGHKTQHFKISIDINSLIWQEWMALSGNMGFIVI